MCVIAHAAARAGRHAAEYAREAGHTVDESRLLKLGEAARNRIRELFLREDLGERVAVLRKEMNDTMEKGAGIYRTEASLQETCNKLAELHDRHSRVHLEDKSNVFNTQLIYTIEMGSMLEAAQTIAHSALQRRESRGSHQRLDYVSRDDENYLKHSLAYYNGEEAPRIEYLDVTITRSPPAERVYGGNET